MLFRECAYCGIPCCPTRDHCQPQHLGGSLYERGQRNWLPACQQCNALKGALPWLWWLRALPWLDERPGKVQGPSLSQLHMWLHSPVARRTGAFEALCRDVAHEVEVRNGPKVRTLFDES